MKIELGKRYVSRDGLHIFGPMLDGLLSEHGYSDNWPFCDGEYHAWTAEGQYAPSGENPYDLVAEYVDPAQQPGLPVIEQMMTGRGTIDRDAYGVAAMDALAEVRRAKNMWPGNFNSAHEGFAIIDEEFNVELKEHVCTNQRKRDLTAMREEAIQVAAMALRFAVECCDETTGRK